MRTQTVCIVVLAAIVCGISAQGSGPPPPPAGQNQPQLPANVVAAIQKLQKDVDAMRATNKFDNALIFADVQALLNATKDNNKNNQGALMALNAAQELLNKAKASGTASPQGITAIVQALIPIAAGGATPAQG